METVEKHQWTNRKYLGGIVHGVAISCIAILLLCQFVFEIKIHFISFSIIFAVISLIIIMGTVIGGFYKPEKIKQ